MDKLKKAIRNRKIEIYRFLEGMRILAIVITWNMWILSSLFSFLTNLTIKNYAGIIQIQIGQDVTIFEIMQALIRIPFYFLTIFLVIYMLTRICIEIIMNDMNEAEKIQVGICPVISIKQGSILKGNQTSKKKVH